MVFSLAGAAARCVAEIAIPFLLGSCIDIVTRGGLLEGGREPTTSTESNVTVPTGDDSATESRQAIAVRFAAIAFCHVVAGAGQGAKAYYANNLGDWTRAEAWKSLFRSTMHAEVGFFDATHTSVINKAHSRLGNLHWIVGHMVPNLASDAISLVVAGGFLLTHQGASIGGPLLPLLLAAQVLTEKYFMSGVHRTWETMRKREREVDKNRTESVSNVRTIKQFSCEDQQARSFEAVVERDLRGRQEHVLTWAKRQFFNVGAQGAGVSLMWALGLWQVAAGTATLGEISAYCVLVDKLRNRLSSLLEFVRNVSERFGDVNGSFDLMHRESPIRYKGGERLLVPMKGTVRFQDVSFSYPSRPDEPVLSRVSLTLHPGTVTALCGPSGGGKSTVANLALQLYTPSSGSVTIDGHDLATLDLAWYHGHTAVVSQEPVLFSLTVAENISFACNRDGLGEVSRAEVIAAAKQANAHDFIMSFAKGYDTQVGEGGVRLSGGQKQRIAIARAIITDPRILILDEATSALDAESEHVVQQALDRVMVGRTTLIIAHRLSTIRSADNIVVVARGEIIEQGRHEELLCNGCGVYADLVGRQVTGSELPGAAADCLPLSRQVSSSAA